MTEDRPRAPRWTGRADIIAQLKRRWQRGELLRHIVKGEPAFPLRMQFKGPSAKEIANQFDDVRSWVSVLKDAAQIHCEMTSVKHRIHGTNAIPCALWIDTLDQALTLIGKQSEADRFRTLLDTVHRRQPELVEWLSNRPLQALKHVDVFEQLLDVVAWIKTNPRPDIYLRQVDLPGIHSKFIEAHRSVLSDWLDLALPPEAINTNASGVAGFNRRYGFRDKPTRIRFRLLDDNAAFPQGDVTLDANSFAKLTIPLERVFITENEINFLALPATPSAMVVFGAGYGWEALSQARWLHQCEIHYWGDIDTHGFAILDQLRACFPHAQSLLMDKATLMAHDQFWDHEASPVSRDLPRLTGSECELYDVLRDNAIREGLRLEQERVAFGFVQSALNAIH